MRLATRLLVLLVIVATVGCAHGGSPFAKRRFISEYRQLLAEYASGDQQRAVEQFVLLELSMTRSANDRTMTTLHDAKSGVHDDLRRAVPAVVPPLVLFHQQAYRAYLDRQMPQLASLARLMATELAETFAVEAETDGDRVLASRMLASLGGYVHEARQESAASRLYRRALDLDALNGPAALGLAAVHEKRGEYSEAVALLEELVKSQPDEKEARLRLGINLGRIDRPSEGRVHLQLLVEGDGEEWLRSLAFEELARLLTEIDDLATARALLGRGVSDLPCDPVLQIHLAYLEDRTGERDAVLDLPGALAGCPHRGLRSPRARYNQPPSGAFDLLRSELERDSSAMLSALTEALS